MAGYVVGVSAAIAAVASDVSDVVGFDVLGSEVVADEDIVASLIIFLNVKQMEETRLVMLKERKEGEGGGVWLCQMAASGGMK